MRVSVILLTTVASSLFVRDCEGLLPLEPDKKNLDVSLCAFDQTFSLESKNDYFPLGVGSEWLLDGEEDGEFIEMRIRALDETRVVGGVTTRVIEEAEWADGELVEISRNFFAVAADGTACYFGEEVDDYEDGEIVSHEGAWRADEPSNFPGIIMPADPRPGMRFVMEGAPGLAEDEGRIVGRGSARVPAGRFDRAIRIRESNPLEGGTGDLKIFARGVGIVTDGPLSLIDYTVADE